MNSSCGQLYLVATPIGNREDITLRALKCLREVDLIAAEDTRHSKLLLQYHHITTPLISLHAFNETQRVDTLRKRLLAGETIALISDAGTPLISDPGHRVVIAVQAAGIPIIPLPGPCAAITALCASGLPTDRFTFVGFLAAKSTERKKQLAAFQSEAHTLIFYESPHRLVHALKDMRDIWGADREIVLAKEITKLFETFFKGTTDQVLQWLAEDKNHEKGEFVILVRGVVRVETEEISNATLQILKILAADLPPQQAVELTARITGEKKNKLKAVCFYKNR